MGCFQSKAIPSVDSSGARSPGTYDGTKDHPLVENRTSSRFFQQLVQEHNADVKVDDYYDIDWSNGATLGTGATSTVRNCTRKATGAIFALKTVALDRLSKKERRMLLEEVRVLKQLDHPNIVRVIETFVDFQRLHIVLERCAQIDRCVEQRVVSPWCRGACAIVPCVVVRVGSLAVRSRELCPVTVCISSAVVSLSTLNNSSLNRVRNNVQRRCR